MKACPFCAEEIQDAAIRCRHCGSMLNALPVAVSNQQVVVNVAGPENRRRGCGCGIAAAVLIVLAIVALSAWRTFGNNVVGRITTDPSGVPRMDH